MAKQRVEVTCVARDDQRGRVLSAAEITEMLERVKSDLRKNKPDLTEEEPGLTEAARNFVHRF